MRYLAEMDFRELHRIGWDLWDPIHLRSTTRPANQALQKRPELRRRPTPPREPADR